MSSQPPEDQATPCQPKSKQERIRDNQRRSRARRQEYLADLERRLSECQLTCREADIQRAAFIELQIENTRLRELLALAGINEQLKPKIVTVDASRTLSSSSMQATPRPRGTQNNPSHTSQSVVRTTPDGTTPPTPGVIYPHSSPYTAPQHTSHNFDWLYQQGRTTPQPGPQPRFQQQQQQQQQPPPIHSHPYQPPTDVLMCDAFGVAAHGPVRVADENSVLCSVAKQMIEQYNISPAEMKQVKLKLSQGFCRSAYPGSGCAVDNQVLFQVLNELSSRYT
ncbi:hypothetical protein LTR05_002944 [Lithohypha guttulata]|uniref:BZIP domain-containing protein n=1 Tax=Lithohypha guttulata TaxID=1690604 RepID=A0AAN7Y837_9EURO|nr:hypothetical protein LTR05_002944 [Lithohypha guttulata]